MLTSTLRSILRVVVSGGAIFGLCMCFYSSVNGDWKIALINLIVYGFSLVMLA